MQFKNSDIALSKHLLLKFLNTYEMKYPLLILFGLMTAVAQAQIGYQVTLLNTATGEPRANETVNVTVEITNSAGGVVCSETKSATTNDFGILSVAVGNSDTFAETDWSKLPFSISATVDGVMIGKSQLLSVPVAEHAKHTGELTREFLNGKSFSKEGRTISFNKNTCEINDYVCPYEIDGNVILATYAGMGFVMFYINGKIIFNTSYDLYK